MASGAGAAFFTQGGRDLFQLGREFVPAVITAQQNPNLLFDRVRADQVNILLIGRDVNWKQGEVFDPTTGTMRPYQVIDEDKPARSDTMIVVTLDQRARRVRMLSFPRDARVRYRDFNGRRHRGKLNSVHSEGGPELLVRVMREEFGIRIDRVAIMRFEGFKSLIDQVGGVEVEVDGALLYDRSARRTYRGPMFYEDKWGGWKVDLQPGWQHLDGEQAHGYVRFRMDREGDPGRIRRQQQVMRALVKKMMGMGLTEMPSAMKGLQDFFLTDLKNEELVSAALFARGLGDPTKIEPLTLFGVLDESGDIILNKPHNEKLLETVLGTGFDPDKFLVLSPSTRRDDLGALNNTSPGALAVLREAGLVKEPQLADAS